MPATISVLYMRMRLAGVCLGVLLAAWLPVVPAGSVLVLLLLAAVPLLAGRHLVAAGLGGACLGLAIAGWQAWQHAAARLPMACTRVPVQVTGVVASLPRVSPPGQGVTRQRFELDLLGMEPSACGGPRRLLLSYYGGEMIEPGQAWSFTARLRRPWGHANPGSHNAQAWYTQAGIDALGSAGRGALRQPSLDQTLPLVHHRWRQALSQRLAGTGLSPDGEAVLRAVTVADKSGIDHGLWTLLQRFGLNHLMVISGLHVGMVAAVSFALARPLCRVTGCRRRAGPLLVALSAAAGYAALAGFSVATQRALLMFSCLVLAAVLGRRPQSAQGLFLALFCVLLISPLEPLGSGFWLSFSAVAALLWLGAWSRGSRALEAVRAHGFMALVMLPLGSHWFGGASLLAAPANLLAVPLFGLWVVPLALSGVVAAIPEPSAADWLWRAATWPLDLFLQWVRAGAGVPPLLAVTPRFPAVLLAALAVALLPVPVGAWVRLPAGILVLPLLFGPPGPEQGTAVAVLDVGQGTAVVVSAGDRALLYDTGGGNPAGANMAQSVVLPFLRQRGIERLDTLVISHGDQDHAAGLHSILDALPVRRLWQGGTGPLHPGATPCEAGRAWSWPGGTRFQFLSPAEREGLTSNDASCVLLVRTARGSVLLAGDIGLAQEYQLLRYWRGALGASVLLVGHHGSGSSTSQAWLNRVAPRVAVLNNAYGNRFGHPHPQVTERLERHGVRQWSTWRSGAVTVRFGAQGEVVVEGARNDAERWWK